MDKLIDRTQFAGWLPIRFYWHAGRPMVDWCQLGQRRFAESFFDQTIEACLCDPFNLLFLQQTPIEVLGKWNEVQPGLKPTGFIFHLSRSGSTLITQLLASLPRNIVISEAPPIDAIVRSYFKSPEVTDELRIEWLRWMIGALAQQRLAEERNFYVKLDAWHILELPLIRKAFPDVPWLFVYRDPVEVMVSQLDHRGAHMVPGGMPPAFFGIDPQTAWSMEPEEYCARVLAALCQAAWEYHSDGGLLVNYKQLPELVWTSMAEFFGVNYSEAEVQIMKTKTKRHAKDPSAPFQGDSAEKRMRANDRVLEAAANWVNPVYEKLEAARLGGPPR
jgi:Sulfotransferase domain